MCLCYNIIMIKISHEFPKNYYLEGLTDDLVDYQYCLAHRYLNDPDYKEYFRKYKEHGTVYLDNSLFELGSSFSGSTYFSIINDLNPDYYFLPDVFNKTLKNVESQLSFFDKYGSRTLISTPIAVCHGRTPDDILDSFKIFDKILPEGALIAIPFGSHAWLNEEEDFGYMGASEYLDVDSRMAVNRGLFINIYYTTLKSRGLHLLGCKGLGEIPFILESKDIIKSIDTSLPVATALEGKEIKINYKPKYRIDEHFDIPVTNMDLIRKNVESFREKFKLEA